MYQEQQRGTQDIDWDNNLEDDTLDLDTGFSKYKQKRLNRQKKLNRASQSLYKKFLLYIFGRAYDLNNHDQERVKLAAQRERTIDNIYIMEELSQRLINHDPCYTNISDWALKPIKAQKHQQRFRSILYFIPLLDPGSNITYFWFTLITILDGAYVAFGIPILFVIGFKNALYKVDQKNVFFEMAVGCLYVVNIFMELITGIAVIHKFNKVKVMDGKFVAKRYVRSPAFYVDLLTVAPFLAEVICFGSVAKCRFYSVVYAINLVRLLRVQRIYTLSTTHPPQFLSMNFFFFLTLLYALAFFINILSAIWFLVATIEPFSWFDFVQTQKTQFTVVDQARANPTLYILSVYYVLTTMTTIGYGDITAQTVAEVIITILFELAGVLTFSILVSVISNFLRESGTNKQSNQQMRLKSLQAAEWFKRQNIHDRKLFNKVIKYYTRYWSKQQEEEQYEIWNDIKGGLREELIQSMTQHLMSKSTIFQHMDQTNRSKIALRLRPVNIVPYQEILQEGDLIDRIWILQEGHVTQFVDDKNQKYMRHDAPYVFGFLSVLGFRSDKLKPLKYSTNTYRSGSWCKLWELKISDLINLFNSKSHIEIDYFESLRGHLSNVFGNLQENQSLNQRPIKGLFQEIEIIISALARAQQKHDEAYSKAFNAFPYLKYRAEGNEISVRGLDGLARISQGDYDAKQNFGPNSLRVSFEKREGLDRISIKPDLESISMELHRTGFSRNMSSRQISTSSMNNKGDNSDSNEDNKSSTRTDGNSMFDEAKRAQSQYRSQQNLGNLSQTVIEEHKEGISVAQGLNKNILTLHRNSVPIMSCPSEIKNQEPLMLKNKQAIDNPFLVQQKVVDQMSSKNPQLFV